ncbi:hypothetical protein BGW80DRAFT_350865 [Lactifluus volemus]|nr:hypothetical protein BGW80DRAFT_350865 [Lactifluus volemus]
MHATCSAPKGVREGRRCKEAGDGSWQECGSDMEAAQRDKIMMSPERPDTCISSISAAYTVCLILISAGLVAVCSLEKCGRGFLTAHLNFTPNYDNTEGPHGPKLESPKFSTLQTGGCQSCSEPRNPTDLAPIPGHRPSSTQSSSSQDHPKEKQKILCYCDLRRENTPDTICAEHGTARGME